MRNAAALLDAVASAPRIPFKGMTYRAVHLRHFPTLTAAEPLFTPAGGLIGSRYVAPGGPEALHVALDAETAHRELNGVFFSQAATPLGAQQVIDGLLRPLPSVILAIHVDVAHVLDLTQTAIRRHFGIRSRAEILGRWWRVPNAPTQLLGTAIFASNRFEGILYPSARNSGHACLILFRQRLTASSRVYCQDTPSGMRAELP
jgi:RES domain-containing protein